MPYENLPQVSSTLLDGAFRTTIRSAQPKVLVLGAALSGRSYELFNVTATGEAEREFGMDTELMKGMHEAIGQGADNIAVMRIGGHQGLFTATQATPSATLVITPEDRDDLVLTTLNLVLVAGATLDSAQRVLIWDNEDEAWIYDSSEELVINTDRVRVVLGSTFNDWAVGDINAPQDAPTLAAIVTGDFTAQNSSSSTMASAVAVAGTDGTDMSLPERYAALAQAYHVLDWRDADIVTPKSAFLDSPNQSDGSTPIFDSAVPVAGTSGDVLGKVWHYIYQGRLYTYMIEGDAVLSGSALMLFGETTVGRITITSDTTGPSGEGINIVWVDDVSATSETVSVSGSTITIHFEDGVSTVAQVITALTASAPASALQTPTASVAGALTIPTAQLGTGNGTYLVLSGVLSHEELTGDEIPAAVVTRWAASVAAEYRECNFAHQLATFLYTASASWKTMIGTIGTLGPVGYDRLSVSEWIGSLPDYQNIGLDLAIDAAGDNGSGLLGNKFLAGEAAYRDAQVTDGDSTDGLAYGGFILTKGLSLPNGVDFPYGISDADEALDSGGRPVDIGRHIVVIADQPKHRNSFNGGSLYRGDAGALLAGKIANTPVNIEPIGDGGLISKVTDIPRIHATQLNDLARIRLTAMRKEDGVGPVLVSVKTAAHPDSDYSLITTTRCVNRLIQGIREIAKKYIGKEFTSYRVAALNTAIEGYLQSQQVLGYHQGAKHGISFSRQDKITGRVRVRLRVIPPFTMRQIDVETSLAADESEL